MKISNKENNIKVKEGLNLIEIRDQNRIIIQIDVLIMMTPMIVMNMIMKNMIINDQRENQGQGQNKIIMMTLIIQPTKPKEVEKITDNI